MSVLFSYAFRSLFLLATLQAIVVVPAWTAAWFGWLPFPETLGTPIWWHAHEMIFGFAGAAIGGFALTAVATWTQRPPVSGAPLVVLSLLWLAARVLFAVPSSVGVLPALAADLAFGALLAGLMTREVVSARNRRNYKVLLILALLPVANALFFAGMRSNRGWTMAALSSGLWLVVLLIHLIGGRIIPTFTRNWLKRQVLAHERAPATLPPTFDGFDLLCNGLVVAFAVAHVVDAPSGWVATLGFVTGGCTLVRLARWQGAKAWREPLVWILHVAFAWLPIGFVLLACAALGWVPRSAGVHALTSGAIATMIVAVAGRAALGHTGRPLESHPILTISYVSITLAAVARVVAAFGLATRPLLMASALAWCFGFLCFAWRYVPILTRPRLQKPESLPTV